jgi:hypothetical protein
LECFAGIYADPKLNKRIRGAARGWVTARITCKRGRECRDNTKGRAAGEVFMFRKTVVRADEKCFEERSKAGEEET